jgi:hypothetical protein
VRQRHPTKPPDAAPPRPEERKRTLSDATDRTDGPIDPDLDQDDEPLDPDANDARVDSAEADRVASEEGTLSNEGRDGSEVTSASEGDPLDDTTPVDNLE